MSYVRGEKSRSRAVAKCARSGRGIGEGDGDGGERADDKDGGHVESIGARSVRNRLRRGGQRWRLYERPSHGIERIKTVLCLLSATSRRDRLEMVIRVLYCTTRHCGSSHTAVPNNLLLEIFSNPHRRANRWAAPTVPSFITSRSSYSPAYLTVLKSSTHSSPVTGG